MSENIMPIRIRNKLSKRGHDEWKERARLIRKHLVRKRQK